MTGFSFGGGENGRIGVCADAVSIASGSRLAGDTTIDNSGVDAFGTLSDI
jgi:hypothetical protein